MNQEILELVKKLISIESSHDKPDRMREAVDLAASEVEGFHIKRYESGGIYSLLVSNREEETKSFKVILNAHLDVVPAAIKQYSPFEKEGRVYGRGAYDMKAAAAVMMAVFKEMADRVDYPLGLQITSDEETGGEHGTGLQVNDGVRAEFAITGEGTNLRILNEAKSRVLIKLVANGVSAHSAYPWLGENAVWKMIQVLNKLHEEFPVPSSESQGNTLNIISIKTENHAHKTPDYCEAVLNARVVVKEREKFQNRVRELVPEDFGLEFITSPTYHYTDPNSLYIKKLAGAVKDVGERDAVIGRAHGGSDARYFTSVSCAAVEFGPVGGGHHGDEEWVEIASLGQYYEILKRFLLSV